MVKLYYSRIKAWYKRHERVVSPIAFASGFVWDNITLQQIDLLYENFTFVWNLVLAIVVIVLINTHEAGRLRSRFLDRVVPFLPIVLQFAFGAILSAFVVFYFRSGSIYVSWPFLLLLVGLFVGNDFFRKRYVKFTFQISILFIALFTYFVFLVPILIGKFGTLVFLVSGLLALLATGGLLYAFFRFLPQRVQQSKRALLFSVGGIYVLFHVLYFANIIPPIPLSVKDIGLYHSLERAKDHMPRYLYEVTFEPAPWYDPFSKTSSTFHWRQGEHIYMYNAIFAPARIDTTVLHRWSFFDTSQGRWVEYARIPFSIAGGRAQGYRGYTFLRQPQPGKWRVDVITPNGQVLGRKTFQVVINQSPPQLETGLR